MITGFLIDMFYNIVAGFIRFLPDAGTGIPQGFIDGLTLILGYADAWNWLLPISDLFVVASFVIGSEVVILTARAVLYIIRIIRGA